jgi:hypothetical protein
MKPLSIPGVRRRILCEYRQTFPLLEDEQVQ